MKMNWDKLLCSKRVSEFCNLSNPKKSQFVDPRSPFEKDCDQIIYSYPFRRLQDKTQVIPFPKFDFVHTRLTHSLEVSTIGRSFGKMAYEIIKDEITDKNITAADIGALVAASCYAHDIGNPPFGHSGEDSISIFFDEGPADVGMYFDHYYKYFHEEDDYKLSDRWGEKVHLLEFQDKAKINQEAIESSKLFYDLQKFEGNANGFRIMTTNCGKGINPTYALLGVFSKYPRESFVEEDLSLSYKRKEAPKHLSKYGFFQAEKQMFKEIAENLGLIKASKNPQDLAYCRHPLAYLMEAADDIAYQMIDFEDGCRLDLIHYHEKYYGKTPKEVLIQIAEIDQRFSINHLNELCQDGDKTNELSYLRSGVINTLIHLCFEVFKDNYDLIMSGKFNSSLIEEIKNQSIQDGLKYMRKLIVENVYEYRPVLASEAAGFEVLEGLIYSFAKSAKLCVSCGDRRNAKEEKIEKLIPKEYRPKDEIDSGIVKPEEVYQRYLNITDYISGMTDGYALNLYKQIKGININ